MARLTRGLPLPSLLYVIPDRGSDSYGNDLRNRKNRSVVPILLVITNRPLSAVGTFVTGGHGGEPVTMLVLSSP
jgi:hypothetical protein